MKNPLNTFVFVYNEEIISPILTTTREYGRWLEELYGSSIAQIELYMKSTKKDGTNVLESHPGTKIGKWFDKRQFSKQEMQSWFIQTDSTIIDKLKRMKLCELRDAIPISVNDEQGRRMLRVYTLNQIELYLRTNVQLDFSFQKEGLFLQPKQIKIRDTDFDKMILPKREQTRKALF